MDRPEQLEVWLLGGFRVAIDEIELPSAQWNNRGAAAIVKLLAMEPTLQLRKEHLADVVRNDDKQLSAVFFRQLLFAARSNLRSPGGKGPFLLNVADSTQSVLLGTRGLGNRSLVWTDVGEFEKRAGVARANKTPASYERALEIYSGDLLPEDHPVRDSLGDGPFSERVASRSKQLRRLYIELLGELAMLYCDPVHADSAIQISNRWIREDPTSEDASRHLMRALAVKGHLTTVTQEFRRISGVLADELDVDPERATVHLHRAILEGGPPSSSTVAGHSNVVTITERRITSNIPHPITNLIGRDRELTELIELLLRRRVITLHGPGGIGKTRLALALAHATSPRFPDGQIWVDLSGTQDSNLIPFEIARALQIEDSPNLATIEHISQVIQEKQLLLMLDNFEHVTSGAEVISTLASTCKNLSLVVTSRRAPNIRGEAVYDIGTLALPDLNDAGNQATLLSNPSITMFLERARDFDRSPTLTEGNLLLVAKICASLEGFPLQIELSVPRLKTMSLTELARSLADSVQSTPARFKDQPQRHHSMRETIQWSYDLLSPRQKRLFRALSVFTGGWTRSAASAVTHVCAGRDTESRDDADLELLLDNSLIFRVKSGLSQANSGTVEDSKEDPPRFNMYQTFKEFGLDQLSVHGELVDIRSRHANFFTELAELSGEGLKGPLAAAWFSRLEKEHYNIVSAIDWYQAQNDAIGQVHLAAKMGHFWSDRGWFREGRQMIGAALLLAGDLMTTDIAEALYWAGALAYDQEDFDTATKMLKRCLSIAVAIDDIKTAAQATHCRGLIADDNDDLKAASYWYRRSEKLSRKLDSPWDNAATLDCLGVIAMKHALLGEAKWEDAERYLLDSLAIEETTQHLSGIATSYEHLGQLAYMRTDKPDLFEAEQLLRTGLSGYRTLGDKDGIADTLEHFAVLATKQSRLEEALRIFGAEEALREELGNTLRPDAMREHDLAFVALKDQVGDADRLSLMRQGRQLGWKQIVADLIAKDSPG